MVNERLAYEIQQEYINDALRWAEHERLARLACSGQPTGHGLADLIKKGWRLVGGSRLQPPKPSQKPTTRRHAA